MEKLQSSLGELSDLTMKYTDANPLVLQKREQIETLRTQITEAATNSTAANTMMPPGMAGMTGVLGIGPGGPILDPNYEIIQGKLRSLEDARITMANRQREAELFASHPPGIVRVFAPANLKTVQSNHRRLKIGIVTIFGGCLGILGGLALALLAEAIDN